MKLVPAVLQFTESQGNPAVILLCPGTEYSVMLVSEQRDGEDGISLKVTPAKYEGDPESDNLNDGEKVPDELDMLVSQSYMYGQPLLHYLRCAEHRAMTKIELSIIHETLEKSKVKLPCSTETTLICRSISMTNGVPIILVAALGLHQPHKELKYSDEELLLVHRAQENGTDPVELCKDVVLDYNPVMPKITEEDRAAYAAFREQVKAGNVPGAHLPEDEIPEGKMASDVMQSPSILQ